MEKPMPYPGNYDGYWFVEYQRSAGVLLVCRVECATWFEQLGELQFAEMSVNLLECRIAGKDHVALSVSVEDYGPGKPTWVGHIRRNPDWPITTRHEWFSERAMEIIQ